MSDGAATGTQSTGSAEAQPAGMNQLDVRVIAACRKIVDNYKRQPSSEWNRADTLINLVSTLPAELAEQPNYRRSLTLGVYLGILDGVDKEAPGAGHDDDERDRSGDGDNGDKEIPRGDRRGKRRSRSITDSSRDSSPEPYWKWRVNPSKFAWNKHRNTSAAGLNPILLETLVYLQEYFVDPKASKRDLLLKADCPEFPESEWTSILASGAVDLDKVYTGIYATK
ncbi:hypothetical protein JAAARDRAFT_198292 [Jaapia argillacea MUCL 33604]|uniref:Uncharacterized protein n=1 Tax=Jaapia argillacea MUCL 33604 TaxID=933084 RepID=A0A067PC81_9AGAM|nr:hypothetical protein JAAARDRAFT_198292 [Jaapia argillacea MUCL 33604]